jgi:hypothetical protein
MRLGVLVLVLAPSIARADGWEIHAAFASAAPPAGHARFESSAYEQGTNQRFSGYGRELGIVRPRMWQLEISAHYLRRHLFLGPWAAVNIPGAADEEPTNRAMASHAHLSNIRSWAVGAEVGGAVPIDRTTIRLSVLGGLRWFDMPLIGYPLETCSRSSRYGTYRFPCPQTATALVPFVQPRIAIDTTLRRAIPSLALGVFAGADIYPALSATFGVTVSFRAPHDMLDP